MRLSRHLLAVGALVILATAFLNSAQVDAREQRSLEQLLTIARSGRQYVPPTPEVVNLCEELFERTLRDPRGPDLPQAWQQLGFRLIHLNRAEFDTYVIVEPPEHKRGWGFYVICPQHAPGLVLQAPHSDTDLHTGDVALRLFADGSFAAAAWNTVPRKYVDVAHSRQHPFSAFTQALIRVHPESCVVQVHGFAPDKRKTTIGGATDLIVSNGTHLPDPTLHRFVAQLQIEFPYGRAQLFPTDVQELGATENIQGQLLRQAGSSRFVHLEMSLDLRLRLIVDPQARQVLLKNLDGCVD